MVAIALGKVSDDSRDLVTSCLWVNGGWQLVCQGRSETEVGQEGQADSTALIPSCIFISQWTLSLGLRIAHHPRREAPSPRPYCGRQSVDTKINPSFILGGKSRRFPGKGGAVPKFFPPPFVLWPSWIFPFLPQGFFPNLPEPFKREKIIIVPFTSPRNP